ncbi:MAG: CBS domain-containing protein [Hyphomicrobiales bacterium]|nr:CBS domain-containing protein [Hyphomicrobiales bacterium]
MDTAIVDGAEGGLRATMALEQALPLVNQAEGHRLPVIDGAGKPIGSITVDAIARAMARREG